MPEKQFFLIKGEYILEGQIHIGYGIGYCFGEREAFFEDLSADCQKASNFVEKCNTAHLSPLHLRDAVDDFLMEY